MEETKVVEKAETEEQKETAGANAAGTEETKEEGTQETQEQSQEQTQPEGDTSEKKEEAMVPSGRLREETEKRKALEAKLAELEGKQTQAPQQTQQMTPEQLNEQFEAEVARVGYGPAVANLAYSLADNIAEQKIAGLRDSVANSQIDSIIRDLGAKDGEILKHSEDIKKVLSPMRFEVKTNPEAIKRVYYQILGERVSKGDYKKEIAQKTKEKIEQKKEIVGQAGVGESKGGTQHSTGLNKIQEEERQRLGLQEEHYSKLLKDMQDSDKAAGRTVRSTVYKLTN